MDLKYVEDSISENQPWTEGWFEYKTSWTTCNDAILKLQWTKKLKLIGDVKCNMKSSKNYVDCRMCTNQPLRHWDVMTASFPTNFSGVLLFP